MTNNMASSGLWEILYSPKLILTTVGTNGCVSRLFSVLRSFEGLFSYGFKQIEKLSSTTKTCHNHFLVTFM